jgi:hypothetical protein
MNNRTNQISESIFLTGSYFVSDARIEIAGRTFDPSKVTEATIAIRRPHRGTAVIVGAFAAFFLLGTCVTFSGTRTVGGAILVVAVNFIDMDGKLAIELVAAINKAIALRKN